MGRAHGHRYLVGVIALAAAGAMAMPASALAVTAAVEGDKLVVTGGDGAETIALGHESFDEPTPLYYTITATGDDLGEDVTAGAGCETHPIGLNESDVAYCSTAVTSVVVSMGAGADDVSSWCSARYVADPVRVKGGGGADSIASATEGSRVTLVGGGGKDGLQGTPCGDNPHNYPVTANGGPQADVLLGHCDSEDKLFGEDGSDVFFAKDGAKDLVSGGAGNDEAATDGKDVRQSIEGNRSLNFC